MHRKVYETRSFNARDRINYVMWTSEMDNCLSKILIERARKGNKLDNTLKPAAFTAALAALNEKFGLDLTKEHIKNRLKTWKKQFRILKELLAQKGFEWDEVHKMVVADDSVWSAYIKAHPDARAFRAKLIENYDELCIIIGNDEATASYSDNVAEADVDLTIEKEGVKPAIMSENQTDDKQTKKLRWSDEMDSCLSKILVEQVKRGSKIDNILQREAYDTAVIALNEKFGPELTKDHIRNRLKTWKKQYGVLKELISQTGFEWDGAQKMVVANDSAWNDYTKTHPDARAFRGRVVENYNPWCIIFGNNSAVEGYSRTGDELVLCLAADIRGSVALNNSPKQCGGNVKDHVKHLRWTSEMDHHLSKILVQQVKLGNKSKFDSKLKTAAYVAAVSSLNERFQLDLTKDHVKNRLKTWKKMHGLVVELLDHGQFEWDAGRRMVLATDSVWYDYIKINPDARLIQGRVIENYGDLCVIFGSDEPSESYSLDGAEIDFDLTADTEGMDNEDAFNNRSDSGKEKGKYMLWTDDMDRCLTEKLMEQVRLGNKLEKNFKPSAYTAVLTTLNEKFALELTKENIRSRLKTWKKQYGLVKELLSYGGFAWDEQRKMVVASGSVWKEYIKKHPDARPLRSKSIENYNELRIIIGNEQAAGYWSRTGADYDANHTSNNEEHAVTPLQVMVDEISHDDTGDGTQGSSQQTGARPSSSSHSEQPSKKRRTGDVMIEMMSAMAANIGRIADVLTENSKAVCLDELFEMVQNIPGFDDDLIIEACEFLSFDEKRAKMFMKLDERLRKLWLLKRLRGQSI
ncbi:uncharacterized protein LOC131149329 [Malania oleifera]|uniref:uncharacterized protein LOC131149329 n=1 Tax=Malania oleifera TaxID=397392 RepID=UPI0025AEB137|nr:uncharacterized protein LOC131149329 [Malania oleifera]